MSANNNIKMRRHYKTEAIVLRTRDLSEKDRIVTFLSPSEGKFDVVCKGAKRIDSKFAGRIEPLNILNLFIATGRNLDVLVQAELFCAFPKIRGDLERSATALYILDMVNRRVEKSEENWKLYNLVKKMLILMEKEVDPELVARTFEIRFLSIMGYLPHLSSCVTCDRQGDYLYFDYRRGGVICNNCASVNNEDEGKIISPGTLRLLRFLANCRLDAIAKLKIDALIRGELKQILSNYIVYNMPGSHVNERLYESMKKNG